MSENAILEKSKVLAVRMVKLYKYLREEKQEYVLSNQVLRSGTSIGANVREAVQGQSRKDFLAKLSIALKEAVETEYWLELLYETDYLISEEFGSIYEEAGEVARLLTSIVKRMREE